MSNKVGSQEPTEKTNVFDSCLASWNGGTGTLRFSRFAHRFERDGVAALYHSLTQQVVYLDAGAYQKIKEELGRKGEFSPEDREIVQELINQGLLVSPDYEERGLIQEISAQFLGKPAFGILYLLLTDVCNLRCRYCFIEGAMPEDHTFSLMDEQTAIKGLRFFADLFGRNPTDRVITHPTIIFYGGEPLLNEMVFLASLKEIARLKKSGLLPPNLFVTLNTNATVLSEEVIKGIVENEVVVSVSLDGPRDLHDANRVFAGGKGTFQTVARNIGQLQKAGASVSISCTITPQNLAYLEDVLDWMVSRFKPRAFGFNLLLDSPKAARADEEYAKEATEKIIACYQIARERGLYEDRILRKVRTFVKRFLHLVDCAACGNQIVITPNGRIGPCHAYMGSGRFLPGDIDDPSFNPFHEPTFVEWSRRSPFNIPSCHSCEAIGLCGGGCAYNAELKSGSIWGVDPNFCIHSKKVLEWLIWDLFAKTKERR